MMKKNLLLMLGLLAYMGLYGQNWQLVWSDEFDGDSLDAARWSYQTGTGTNGIRAGPLGKQRAAVL